MVVVKISVAQAASAFTRRGRNLAQPSERHGDFTLALVAGAVALDLRLSAASHRNRLTAFGAAPIHGERCAARNS